VKRNLLDEATLQRNVNGVKAQLKNFWILTLLSNAAEWPITWTGFNPFIH
jgi:hypothetical protein